MTTVPRARDALVPLALSALPVVLGVVAMAALHAGTTAAATAVTFLVVTGGILVALVRRTGPDDDVDAAWARVEPRWSGRPDPRSQP